METTMQDGHIYEYTAASMREALAKVKTELGRDALILSQERIDGRVVVKACLEMPEPDGVDDAAAAQEPAPDHDDAEDNEPADLLDQVGFAEKPVSSLKGIFRFVGASGVGKTSTLIKVLVEWSMRNRSGDVLVVTADNQKLAGTESLQLACQMLGIRLEECDLNRLEQRLPAWIDHDLVLIDTPALDAWEQASFVKQPGRVRTGMTDVMVVSAQHSRIALDHQCTLLRKAGVRPELAVLTHMDQPYDHQTIVSWLGDQTMALAWLGTSSYLPEGLETAAKEHFAAETPDVTARSTHSLDITA